MNRTLTRATLPVLAAATALTLAACGASTTSPSGDGGIPVTSRAPSASGMHNQSDIDFAVGMIPHHAQAVTMADLALTTATNTKVKDLATAIKAAQDPEIKTMSGWLTSWGQPVPAANEGHDMSQMGSSGGATTGDSDTGERMGGLMTDQEMQQLSGATGMGFDRMWLQLMIKHHQGAVAMAQSELTGGAHPDAKKLAQAIIDGQTTEITSMTDLLPTITG